MSKNLTEAKKPITALTAAEAMANLPPPIDDLPSIMRIKNLAEKVYVLVELIADPEAIIHSQVIIPPSGEYPGEGNKVIDFCFVEPTGRKTLTEVTIASWRNIASNRAKRKQMIAMQNVECEVSGVSWDLVQTDPIGSVINLAIAFNLLNQKE